MHEQTDKNIKKIDMRVDIRLVALSFLAGTLLIQLFPQLPSLFWLVLLLSVSLIIVVLLLKHYRRMRYYSNLLLVFISGLLVASYVAQNQLDKRLSKEFEGRDLIVSGQVIDIPESREDGVRFRFKLFKAHLPQNAKAPVNINGIVRLGWYQNYQNIHAGETWQLRIRLKQPSGFLNPGGFDYEKWLFTQRIIATGYVRASKDSYLQQIKKVAESPWWSISRLRQDIHLRIQRLVEDKSSASVLSALVVAVRSKLNDEQWEQLQQTGTSHLIAISGLHIAVVAGFAFLPVLLIWRVFPSLNERIPIRVAGGIVGVIFASAYAVLAGFTLPTQRALLMVIIALLGLISRRNFQASSVLALAMLAVLILDPLASMTVSFWLSFLSVSLILIFVKRQIEQPNFQLIKLQLVLSLGMLPLTLFFFNTVSLTSPLANLFAIPWVSLIIVPLGLLSVLFMPVSELVSGALLSIASLAINYLFKVLNYLSNSSFGAINLAEIPGVYLLIAFLGLLFMLFPKGFPARWLGILALLPAFLYNVEKPLANTFTYTLLDAGQGMASVIETKNHLLIYDTGTRLNDTYDIGKLVLIPYLKSKGVKQVDSLIISHEDNDHRGGAESLLNEIKVNKILSSDINILQGHRQKTHIQSCIGGMQWNWDGVDFKILSPPEYFPENDNNRSCVLRVSNPFHSLLITADIETKTENLLIEQALDELDVDVLTVPHHGSKTSSSEDFIKAVSPQVAIIPVGYRNRFHHPANKILQRYQENNVRILDTVKYGAIELLFTANQRAIQVKSYRQENQGFWSRK